MADRILEFFAEVFCDDNFAALLRSPIVDVVHLTSPNEVHVEQSLATLADERGLV